MHCGFRLHSQNGCYAIFGILLPNTGYTWTEGIATNFIFSYSGLYYYWEYGIEHVLQ